MSTMEHQKVKVITQCTVVTTRPAVPTTRPRPLVVAPRPHPSVVTSRPHPSVVTSRPHPSVVTARPQPSVVTTRPPTGQRRKSCETLPVCQTMKQPARAKVQIYIPTKSDQGQDGQDLHSLTEGHFLSLSPNAKTFVTSPFTTLLQTIHSPPGSPPHDDHLYTGGSPSPQCSPLHDDHLYTGRTPSPQCNPPAKQESPRQPPSPDSTTLYQRPPRPPKHREQNKPRIQFAQQRSDNSDDGTLVSPPLALPNNEPTRLQSILHRRVSLMEMGKDIDSGGNLTKILVGKLDDLPPVASKTVRVFLSSTFSDMVQERNALMEDVYPRLKDICREQYGLEFQVVDLRWGVREEAQDDHATIDVCLQEIENCKTSSIGPSFVAFIGQKYGYRPFPPKIPASEFTSLRDALVQEGKDVSVLDKWFKIDRNTIPSIYRLQPISSILKHYNDKTNTALREADSKEWYKAFEHLQKLLRHAAEVAYETGEITEKVREKYFISVTELEIERGMMDLMHPGRHCFCFYRHINELEEKLPHKRSNKFMDLLPEASAVDEEAQNLLRVMKARKIENSLVREQNIRHFYIDWSNMEEMDPNDNPEYLADFCRSFYDNMLQLIQKTLHYIEDLQKNQNVVEILQHLVMCKWRSDIFRGREEVLGKILDYLYHPAAEPLIVYGESGSGKTSVVAKAAHLTHRWFKDKQTCVVLRFMGTTVRSCSIRLVLGNISWQIAKLYGEDSTNIPQDYPKLVRHFHKILKVATVDRPLVIFMDSLDQLSSSHRAHNLGWVPQELPPNVHLILSTLPNMHGLLDTLHTLIKDPHNFVEILPLGMQLSQDLIREWLRAGNRTLTTRQFDVVRDALERCSLPLYTKLIFEEICRWKSYSPPEISVLASSVKGVINTLFDRVERYHGRTFVIHALSYLTASRNGLSDNELEDLLSLDDVVLDDVFQHWVPPIRRIPPLLWPRLLNEMSSYIMKREANGIIVFYWYHRQFISVAQERFLSDIAHRIFIHTMIAHYFLGTWGGGLQKAFLYTDNHMELLGKEKRQSLADRKVPPQPLVFNQDPTTGKVMYNLRKLSELPYHLLLSRRVATEMKSEVLFKYNWLHAKLSAMGLQDVLSDFRSVLETEKDPEISLVGSALRVGGSYVNQNPDTLSFDLTGRLLPYYNDHLNIRNMIRQCDTEAHKHSIMVPIYQCFEAPKRMLLYVLEDHTQIVFDLVFSKLTNELVSISKDGNLAFWDMNFGEKTRAIDVSYVNPGPNTKMYQSAGGNYLVVDSDSVHSELLIFDVKTGHLLHKVGKKSAASRRAFMSGHLFCRQKNIIDVRTGMIVKTLDDYVESKSFVMCGITPNEKYVLIGQEKATTMFDLEMNVCLMQYKGDNMPCQFVITPDSKKVFIGYTDDCVFKVCNIDPDSPQFGEVLVNFNYKDALPHTKFLDGPLFHKELAEITICEKNPNLVLLNVKRCHLILFNLMTQFAKLVDTKAINVNSNTFLFGSSFSMDGRYLLAGSHANLHIWSTENCKLVSTMLLHTNNRFPMAMCLQNNLAATGSNIHTAIKVWDLTKVQAAEPGSLFKYSNPVNTVASAPERRLLFIKHYYNYSSTMGYKYHDSFGIDIWNISTGTRKNYLPLLSYGTLVQMEVSYDGLKMAMLLKTRDDTYLIMFNTKTGKVLCNVMHPEAKSFGVSPQWDYVTTCSEKDTAEVILWNVSSGDKIHAFNDGSSPVFSLDNLYVLVIKEKERIVAYSLKARDITVSIICEVDLLQPVPNLHQVVIATKKIAQNSLSDHSQVTLWNFHSSKPVTRLYGVAPGGIVDISKDGLRTVDRYLQVYDLKSGSLLCRFSPDSHHLFEFVNMTYDSRCVIWVDKLSVKVGHVSSHQVIGNVSLHEKPTSITLFDYGYVVVIGREDGHLVTLKLMNKGDERCLQDEKITTIEQRATCLLDIPACSEGVIRTMDLVYRKKPTRIKDSDIPKPHDIDHVLTQKAKVPHAVINSLSFPDLLGLEEMAKARRGSSPCHLMSHGRSSGSSTPGNGTPVPGSPVLLRKKKADRHRSKSTQDINDVSGHGLKKSRSMQDLFNVNRTPPPSSSKNRDDKKTKRKSPLMMKALHHTGQMFMALAEIGSSRSLPRKKSSPAANREALRLEMERMDSKEGSPKSVGRGRIPSM